MNPKTIILTLAIKRSPQLLTLIMAYQLYKAYKSQPNKPQRLLIATKLINLIKKLLLKGPNPTVHEQAARCGTS